jgi:choline dehydrogenase
MNQTYDYVIIGAGTAGCVLANRLSEDPNTSVLLLEFGGSDRSIFIQMPTALSIPMSMSKYNWGYESQPEPYLNNRRIDCARGKVLGGSSSINGMVYVRGHAMDFDEWQEHGAKDWDYSHCLPYFKKAEDWAFGSDDYRNQQGPLSVNNGNNMQNPLYRAFIEAGAQAGYMKTEDYNGRQQEGFGAMHMTVKNGVRWSTANAYLKPVRNRPNLQVISGALTQRILLEGKKATGVEFLKGGKLHTASANRDLILSAGSIASPHLLQLSGIGPAQVLKTAGIEVKHDLPGVGENLQDHLEFYFQFRCKQPITLNGQLNLWNKFLIGTRWILTKKGLGATNHFESCAFIRSKAGVKWPDIQYHFLPAAMRYDGRVAFDGHGFQVHVGHNKPLSRGTVKAMSPKVTDKPQILFNYLQHKDDIEGFRACVRLTREIISQPAMDAYRGSEIQPGEDVKSDADIDAFVRSAAETAYHPSCTCRMGEDDMAVVDSDTRVRGIEGLRVVDSSIFPTIPNGNLNSPTIMVAERAADIIKGKGMLEASQAAVGLGNDWEGRQRSTSSTT